MEVATAQGYDPRLAKLQEGVESGRHFVSENRPERPTLCLGGPASGIRHFVFQSTEPELDLN